MSAADFHFYAGTKLRNVLGDVKGDSALAQALMKSGIAHIDSADDLHRVGRSLILAGGFAGAVGGLLSVHAVMHGARPSDSGGSP